MIDNYKDLPLGIYEQICAVKRDEEIDTQVAVIALLSGCTEREVLNLPIAEYAARSAAAGFLAAPPEKLPRVADAYRAGGFKLVPTRDLRKLTAAQYIDFQAFAPDADHRLVEILSCFIVPDECKYGDGYDIDDVHAAIRELSVADALALSAFFFGRYAALIRSTRISLERMRKRERDPEKMARIAESLARLKTAGEALGAGLRA